MDYSKFKKVSSDKDCTTLVNHNGHEIKVVHKVLSPKLRAELDKLPMAKGGKVGASISQQKTAKTAGNQGPWRFCPRCGTEHPNCICGPAEWKNYESQQDISNTEETSAVPNFAQRMAKGGEAKLPPDFNYRAEAEKEAPAENVPSQTPVSDSAQNMAQQDMASDQTPQAMAPSSPAPAVDTPAQMPQKVQAPQATVPADNQQIPVADTSTATEATQPVQPPSQEQQYQNAYDSAKQEHLQEYAKQDQAWQQDLNNGHITPETYGSLFAKKDTLGKIGSIFGMMLGGAGSGLAHQQNAYLHALDQQINNDLQAQTTSKNNAQNFIRLNQQHQMQNAQIGQMGTQTAAQKQDIGIKANTFARMQMNRIALHSLVQKVNSMNLPPQQRAQAEQQLQAISPIIDSENYNLADAAAARSASMRANDAQNGGSAVNYQKMNQLEIQSHQKLLGAPSSEDLSAMTKEATGLEETRALRNDFNEGYSALDKMALAGKLSPNARDSYVQSLAGKLAKASAGRYNQREAENQINSMIPNVSDWSSTRDIRRNNNNKFFDVLEAGTPTLNRFGLKNAANEGSQQTQNAPHQQDAAAMAWAKSNPNDPRSAKIMKANGK